LPLRKRQEDEERYLFYVALTRASEGLVLSYSAFDEEGTPRPPSPYLEEALSHFESVRVRKVALAEQYALPEDAVMAADLLPIVADGLSRSVRGEGAVAASLHDRKAVSRGELAWPRRLEILRSTPVTKPGRDYAEKLSATAINAYRRCPYLFFVRRVFRVEPGREAALDPRTRGTVVHEALDRIFQFPDRDPGEIFDEVFTEHTRQFRVGLGDEAARRWMRTAVLNAAEEMRNHEVLATEMERSTRIEDVELVGRIDRIDRLGKGELVRDYKTGAAPAKPAFQREDLQLDCYLLLVDRPAGAVYERLRKGDQAGFVLEGHESAVHGKDVEILTPEALAARGQGAREIILSVARAIRAGRLAVHPAEPESCTRKKCDGYDLCRVVRARWLAKSAREQP
ncbi:MAG: PD-(D/E)XK nuclease family protein, partial [Planctomycetota bacterium]